MSPLNDAPKPRIPDAIDKQRLQAMQLVAKMKESADKYGVGFVGGFVSPDGQKFMMTNMDEADTNALLPEDLKWQRNHPLTLTVLLQVSTSPRMVSSRTPNRFSLVPSNWHSMPVTLAYMDLYPCQVQV